MLREIQVEHNPNSNCIQILAGIHVLVFVAGPWRFRSMLLRTIYKLQYIFVYGGAKRKRQRSSQEDLFWAKMLSNSLIMNSTIIPCKMRSLVCSQPLFAVSSSENLKSSTTADTLCRLFFFLCSFFRPNSRSFRLKKCDPNGEYGKSPFSNNVGPKTTDKLWTFIMLWADCSDTLQRWCLEFSPEKVHPLEPCCLPFQVIENVEECVALRFWHFVQLFLNPVAVLGPDFLLFCIENKCLFDGVWNGWFLEFSQETLE